MSSTTVSVCIIAKDESAMIGDCIASVTPWADEVIVVDTGSSDSTIKIATRAGASVHQHPWTNDFSAARNAALSYATSDWILILDADERLYEGAWPTIISAVSTGTFDLGFLTLHNANTMNASHRDVMTGQARIGEAVLLPRLMKRTPDLRWEGVVHENINTWFEKGRIAQHVPADIIHYGNVAETKISKNKSQRNLTLLERACGINPNDPMLRAWLARELIRSGQTKRARQEAEAAWADLITARQNDENPAIVMPATIVAFLRLEDKDAQGVLSVVEMAQGWGSVHPNLDLLAASALEMSHGDPMAIESAIRSCLKKNGQLFACEVMPGATTWAPTTILGSLRARQGRHAEALEAFQLALSTNSQHSHARLKAAEVLLQLDHLPEVLAMVEPAMNEDQGDAWVIAAVAAARLGRIDDAKVLVQRAQGLTTPIRQRFKNEVNNRIEAKALLWKLTGGPPSTIPMSVDALIKDGECRYKCGNLDGATDRFVRALVLDCGCAEAWVNLAVCLVDAELIREAWQALQMGLRLEPTHRQGWINLGKMHRCDENLGEAADAFRHVLNLHPDDNEARMQLNHLGVTGQRVPQHPSNSIDLTVIVDATGHQAYLTGLFDRLALQELPQNAFHVITIGSGQPRGSRPFSITQISDEDPGAWVTARQNAQGSVVLLLKATDRPNPNLLAQHLRMHKQADDPIVVTGPRHFSDRMLNDPLVSCVSQIKDPHSRPYNVSIPSNLQVDLTLPRSMFAQQLQSSGISVIREDDLSCKRGDNITLDVLLNTHRQYGVSQRAHWENNPDAAIFDLPPNANTPACWLTVRHQLETDENTEVSVLARLRAGRDPSVQMLDLVLTQARRRGLLNAANPTRPKNKPLSGQLTSIIIPNLNGFPHLIDAIESLRCHTTGPVEVIVVDNGSNDGSLEWLREQNDVTLLEMGENIGAPAARNRGLEIATGESIVFCDNDVVFTPNWRPLLLAHLERWPDIGMVGPMSDYVVGPQKYEPLPHDHENLDTYAQRITQTHSGQHLYTHRLILFFLIARREVIERIGGIDEGYGRWGFEDDDLSLRVSKAGYRMRIAQDCFIRHIGSQTSKTANLDYDRLLLENWEIFKRKWQIDPQTPYGPYDPEEILARHIPMEQLYVPYRQTALPTTPNSVKLVCST